MSEEQNDSPAFRLRPRRAAPKSYYTVRLEYSANPAAFVRERPRNLAKRRVFSQKTGSNSTKLGLNQHIAAGATLKPQVITKEEREREERRLLLHREISQSITTNTLMSPFIQRVQLDELQCDSVYEHNYITLKIKEVKKSTTGQLLLCLGQSADTECSNHCVNVRLHNEYADADLVKPGKILSIGKFRTGPTIATVELDDEDSNSKHQTSNNNKGSSAHPSTSNSSMINQKVPVTTTSSAHDYKSTEGTKAVISIKCESNSDQPYRIPKNSSSASDQHHYSQDFQSNRGRTSSSPSSTSETTTLPFNVIVKYDELAERSTSNSNRGSSLLTGSTCGTPASGAPSVTHRPLIPFLSVTDMIEQPTEPFVEMSPPSPSTQSSQQQVHSDHENNQGMKKVKFSANSPD